MVKRTLTALMVASLVLGALAYGMPFLERAWLQDAVVETTAVSMEPTALPIEPSAVPVEPTAMPVEPTAIPVEPTVVPVEPTAIPVEPTAVPLEPTFAPSEPTIELPMVETLLPPAPTVEVPNPNDLVPTLDPSIPVPTVDPAVLPPTPAPAMGAIETTPIATVEIPVLSADVAQGGISPSPEAPVTESIVQMAEPAVVAGIGGVSGVVDSASSGVILVILTDTNGQVVASTVSAADGSFALIDVPAGNYILTLDDGISLLNQQAVSVTSGQVTTLPLTSLVWGDVNRDNTIDELDVVTIASLYGQPAPTSPVSFDINGDGRVGLRELMLLAENYRFGR